MGQCRSREEGCCLSGQSPDFAVAENSIAIRVRKSGIKKKRMQSIMSPYQSPDSTVKEPSPGSREPTRS